MSAARPARRALPAGLATCMALLLLARAQAQDVPPATDAAARDVEQFCTNIAEPARDRRYLIQKQQLADLKAGIDARMKALDAKRAEYEDWLTRRNDFLKSAQADLVDIYNKMESDAAASQLELLDPNIAAAIIMKLPPNKASAILNEMKAEKAARLAAIIASASDPTTSRNPS